jgi:phage shock protein A
MAQKVDQIEAEAEAQTDLAQEYTGDALASKFEGLEREHGAEDDLVALKRKMGMLPPEEHPPARDVQARVEVPAAGSTTHADSDHEELAAALDALEAEQLQNDGQRKAQR